MMSLITTTEVKCRDCYRCLRSCPVNAIRFTKGSDKDKLIRAAVMDEYCILDGQCVNICPQQAKKIRNDVGVVKGWVEDGQRVACSVAPSFPGALYLPKPNNLPEVLRGLGFCSVEETAVGAEFVAKMHQDILSEQRIISPPQISTSCPVIVNIVEKHYPEVISHLTPIVSPMVAHARYIKERDPELKVVFIGPCFAKKYEGEQFHSDVDAVLTFEELRKWILEVPEVNPKELVDGSGFDGPSPRITRLFPLDGGLIKSAFGEADMLSEDMLLVTGVQQCIDTIRQLKEGSSKTKSSFIEMMACDGGCINGPGTVMGRDPYTRRQLVIDYYKETGEKVDPDFPSGPRDEQLYREYFNRKPVQDMPTEEQIREILGKVGKFYPDEELNCSACGFQTCRDKAIAVYRGYADPEMCIPYMRVKAESISNVVVNALPGVGVIVVDYDLEIIEANNAALQMFAGNNGPVVGQKLSVMIGTDNFKRAMREKKPIKNRITYPKLSLVTDELIFLLEQHGIIVGIIIDVTEEEARAERAQQLKESSISQIQEVIDKQMKVVQEIAGILGENTAETKVLLKKLIKIMQDKG